MEVGEAPSSREGHWRGQAGCCSESENPKPGEVKDWTEKAAWG